MIPKPRGQNAFVSGIILHNRLVMWEKHGVFAVDCDAMQAFDQIDVLNKSALIYIAAKNMGFEPDGMSQEQMKEMSVAFNLPK